jgi:hypothetical protein
MRRTALHLLALALMSTVLLSAQVQIVGKFGRATIGGRDAVVHVLVAVPQGVDADQAAAEALKRQRARPFTQLEEAEFTTTGLVWDVIANSTSESVDQHYNNAGAPVTGGKTALVATHTTWNSVSSSKFVFRDAGDTDRCPSLVPECDPNQTFDTHNDVGWCDLGPGHRVFGTTIGVTWYSTEIDEADMCLNNNSRVTWSNNGTSDIDVQTVLLHENGHVAGIGHSEFQAAVMYASYQGVRRSLHGDDQNAITCLYPFNPGSIGGTVSQVTGGAAIAGATVAVNACQAQFSSLTDAAGSYFLGGLPAGTYSVTASASGFQSSTLGTLVSSGVTSDLDFFLEATSSGGGGSCTLKPSGAACSQNSECCSGNCKGKPGAKTCK